MSVLIRWYLGCVIFESWLVGANLMNSVLSLAKGQYGWAAFCFAVSAICFLVSLDFGVKLVEEARK